ncbi:hypothetical protein Pyrfu_0360 [Pyrolobus fumarii 1A]|uniref:DUF5591 domain-containing protein n=1 Tax=Pyrolobus fumarii (strain DSM 11204 / 1A) TaxID=694429 RepID=G0EFR1_PYRF1|nr:DUF5591 domain-containing protein [Pyrolobus fumarii]AEM38232.1 hypothetical protein Pyrfu_0360 [Pyrolobus fumarii 1A]
MQRLRVPKDRLGRFPARHHLGIDPQLTGIRALEHRAVREWHHWLADRWLPEWPVLLITPCSNVKPYTRSPTSRKIAAVLRRLGLWRGGAPFGVEWLYLSDLLVLVPYVRAGEYPACCYELHPEELLKDRERYELIVGLLSDLIARKLWPHTVILFLPRRHLELWSEAYSRARLKPRVVRVAYTIFSVRGLEEAVRAAVVEAARATRAVLERGLGDDTCSMAVHRADGSYIEIRHPSDCSGEWCRQDARFAETCLESLCRRLWLVDRFAGPLDPGRLPDRIRSFCVERGYLPAHAPRQVSLDEILPGNPAQPRLEQPRNAHRG